MKSPLEKPEEVNQDDNSFITESSQTALEWCAVLASQKIDFELGRAGEVWTFKTTPANFAEARRNIEEYENDRDFFKRYLDDSEMTAPRHGIHDAMPFVFISVLLLLFFSVTGSSGSEGAFFTEGMLSPDLLGKLQWWRGATALTLHADLAHVVANCVFFTLFSTIISASAGPGITTAAILFAAFMANTSSAFILGPAGHSSIGLSTAVFAALGIITISGFLAKKTPAFSIQSLAPVAAGIALLAFTGSARGTDLLAHLSGFLWGVAIGIPVFKAHTLKNCFLIQSLLFIASFALVAFAWTSASNAS
ncbi:MAG: rhomboid family intramembrane serine protease [Victivallales bacterium]|nr:rhomboid family intramembrane serine protease [Victivallales bacterium]